MEKHFPDNEQTDIQNKTAVEIIKPLHEIRDRIFIVLLFLGLTGGLGTMFVKVFDEILGQKTTITFPDSLKLREYLLNPKTKLHFSDIMPKGKVVVKTENNNSSH